jgi:outer membrane autotransporter protein
MKTWDANVNLEYTINLFEDCEVYPIVGFSYSHWTMEMPTELFDKAVNTWDKIGGNVGVGIEYNVATRLAITAEIRGQIMEKYSQCILGAGVKYRF